MKKFVWGENDDIILICRRCHDKVEAIVSKKENEILQMYPNIGRDAMREVMNDARRHTKRNRKDVRTNGTKYSKN